MNTSMLLVRKDNAMGDVQRCEVCGGDRLAEVLQDGKALCAKCAGQPSALDRFQELVAKDQSRMREMFLQGFDPRRRLPTEVVKG